MKQINKLSKKIEIPLCVPEIRKNEWLYIKKCLDENWISSFGEYVERFERSVAEYLGVKYAVSCINGTSALHIALLVSGISPDEEVLIPALSFVAPANAVRYIGAWPVFIDVSLNSWQMDPQKTIEFLTKECTAKHGKLVNKHTRRFVRGILPVHILGQAVDMDSILDIAKRFNLVVIEDVAESLGAIYKSRKVGTLGSISCLSFNGNKIITTGNGGMIVTNNIKWANKARYFINQAKDNPLEYIHNEIGYNYRLSNINAALGVAQMEKLDEYIAKKKRIASRYNAGLCNIGGITLMANVKWSKPSFWLYTILVNAKNYGVNSRVLLAKLCKNHIESRPFWHPLHSLKPFKQCYAYQIKVANRLYRDGLSLPSSVNLLAEEQAFIIESIKEFAKK